MSNWEYSNYSNVRQDVMDNFPFPYAREGQLETISEIVDAIEKGYKYIILEAGTGTGKSAIAATLASIYDSSYILTATKQLQQQYMDDFEDNGFVLVKGRSNFQCRRYAEDVIDKTCEFGRCNLESYNCSYKVNENNFHKFNENNSCSYYYQKVEGLLSPVVITNYAYAFLDLNYDDSGFGPRTLMICDEAHNLENRIMNLLSLEFSEKELNEDINLKISSKEIEALENNGYKFWISFIEGIIEKYSEQISLFANLIKNDPKNLNYIQKVDVLKKRVEELFRVINYIEKDPINWVFDYNPLYKIIAFKPIRVNKYAKSVLFNYADVCIFMSATILNYKLFSKWLGIDESEIYAIRKKSPFDIARNPIKTYDGFIMTKNYIDKSIIKAIPTLKDIINKHKNEKGIIHTHSHKNKDKIYYMLGSDRSIANRLITHESYTREEKLKEFVESEDPVILISPSMNEGVDLPDDLCRFQIMLKIPYPYLGDTQISRRTHMEEEWYKFQTVLSLVQTYGRGMRSENDYCKTYFIDGGLKDFIKWDERYYGFIPNFFKNAINVSPADINQKVKVKNIEVPSYGNGRTKESVLANANNLSKSIESEMTNGNDVFIGKDLSIPSDKSSESCSDDDLSNILNESQEIKDSLNDSSSSNSENLIPKNSDMDLKSGEKYSSNNSKSKVKKGYSKSKKDSQDSNLSSKSKVKKGYSKSKKDSQDSNLSSKSKVKKSSSKSKNVSQDSNLSKNRIKHTSIKDLKNQEDIVRKFNIISNIDDEYYEGYYNSVINKCKKYLNDILFKEDYYLYKMLVKSYEKIRDFDEELNIIKIFLSSNIYCSDYQALWFRKHLKKLQKTNNLSNKEIKNLFDSFEESRQKNKKQKTYVPIADRIVKENGLKLIDEEDFEKLEKIEYIKEKANFLRNKRKYKQAIQLYEESINDGLVDFNFYQGLASCYRKLNDYEGGIKALNKFYVNPPLKEKPNHRRWITREISNLSKKK